MIELAAQRYDLAAWPLKQVSGIASQIAAEVSLSPGTARRWSTGRLLTRGLFEGLKASCWRHSNMPDDDHHELP